MNVPIANSRVARSLSMQRVCELYTTDSLSQKVKRADAFCATAKVLRYLFGHLGSQLLRTAKKRTISLGFPCEPLIALVNGAQSMSSLRHGTCRRIGGYTASAKNFDALINLISGKFDGCRSGYSNVRTGTSYLRAWFQETVMAETVRTAARMIILKGHSAQGGRAP